MRTWNSLPYGYVLIVFGILWSGGCGSPQNHKVRPQGALREKVVSPLKMGKFPLEVAPQWITGPVGSVDVKNQLLVIVRNPEGVPTNLTEGLTLAFYGTMTSMGHPMEDAGFFESLGDGLYINREIRYNMPGDWRNELWIMDKDFNILDRVPWDIFF